MAKDSENDPFESAFLEAFPNPERIGCPSKDILYRISRQDLPVDHPAVDHLAQCSPCFRDVRLLQTKRAQSNTRASMAVATSLVAGITAGVMYLALRPPWRGQSGLDHPQPKSATSNDLLVMVLNFNSEAAVRGESDNAPQRGGELQRLRRKNLTVRVYLPLGMEAGHYDVALAQERGPQRLETSGTAQIQDGLAVLTITSDFSKLPAVSYHFNYRLSGATWRTQDVVLY